MIFTQYADICFRLPIREYFTYEIPDELAEKVKPGCRVIASLRGKEEEGIVRFIHNQTPSFDLSKILKVVDEDAIVNEDQMKLSEWMAEFYLSGYGEALFKMFPNGKRRPSPQTRKKVQDLTPDHELNDLQRAAYESVLKDLPSALNDTESQKERATPIHLLFGITGSGKTEVYIHILRECLERNQNAILLVPEISLTVQLVQRLHQVFGEELALLHSGLSGSDRFRSYIRVLRGECSIAVGTRSAVFAPVKNPAIIIIDEEHDGSFKEHSSPRYDARQIAMIRTRNSGGVVLFGSATPRIETMYRCSSQREEGGFRYFLHVLTKRATGAELPDIHIIEAPPADIPVTGDLVREIGKNLDDRKQSLLLLNRRGHAPYLYCSSCAATIKCPSCSVALTVHRNNLAMCHYCGHRQIVTDECPECNNKSVKRIGSGTQKLEDYLLNLYPSATLERLDSDSAINAETVEQTIGRLVRGEMDILVGTQMIAKGLDAPGVTLVGVLQADNHLGLPDFRAAERTFSLLTQVAGRAGRSSWKGRVYFEVLNPNEIVILDAARQDYLSFYKRELEIRKIAGYPPYMRIIRLLVRSSASEEAYNLCLGVAEKIREAIHNSREVQNSESVIDPIILGPAPAPLEKLNNKYRYHVLIKTNQIRKVRNILDEILSDLKKGMHKDAYLEIDFDPVDLL